MNSYTTHQKRRGILFCLVGPAGSGKSTIASQILHEEAHAFSRGREVPALRKTISVTTRHPRTGEQEGKDYHFVAESTFDQMITAGEFFEWEQIHHHRYGTLKSELTCAIETGQDLLLVIDINGAKNIKQSFPGCSNITFVVPESFQILSERMRQRGDNNSEDLERRITTAKNEYALVHELLHQAPQSSADGIDYLVVNQILKESVHAYSSIIAAERHRASTLVHSYIDALFAHAKS